ncbi:pyrroline-5-carboxylate reductase [Duncaniella dubosii]|uniref:Pyrroline-5-carboxylate reductase n=2 Tax=Duncaniella TaxID=2518495 RepID=A0A4P7W671_9BACT|nr:pyrroline-5-carboxylate reductase [Duncaniella dubosii]
MVIVAVDDAVGSCISAVGLLRTADILIDKHTGTNLVFCHAHVRGDVILGEVLYRISVSNPSSAPLEILSQSGARVTSDNIEACRDAELIIVAVKPWIVEKVLTEIKESLDYERQSVVVIAAGLTGAQMSQWLSRSESCDARLLIAMPNTAVSAAQSMTFIVPVNSNDKLTSEVVDAFGCLGETMVIDEPHLPAATALASCGIAYAMRYVRAAVEGGVELGFKADAAQRMVVQTIRGAAALLSVEGAHPEREIDKVTTPGGITIRGLNEMEHAGFSSAVIRGLKASVK